MCVMYIYVCNVYKKNLQCAYNVYKMYIYVYNVYKI